VVAILNTAINGNPITQTMEKLRQSFKVFE